MAKTFRKSFYENTGVTEEDLASEEKLKDYVEARMMGVTYEKCQRARATTRYILGIRPDKVDVYLNKRMEMRFNNVMDVRNGKSCTLAQDGRFLLLDVPHNNEEPLRFSYNIDCLDQTENLPDPVICLGEYVSGDPVLVSLDNENLLIAGRMGSGKSVCLHNVILSLLYKYTSKDLQMYFIDPKNTTFHRYEGLSAIKGAAYDRKTAVGVLKGICDEMDDRYKKLASVNREKLSDYNKTVKESDRLPHLVLFVEEVDSLLAFDDPARKDEILLLRALLTKLAKEGRACGIHLIVASQKPSGETLPISIRSQLGVRIALRLETSHDSRIVINQRGAESLRGKGDAYIMINDQLNRFQNAMIEAEEFDQAIDWLTKNR